MKRFKVSLVAMALAVAFAQGATAQVSDNVIKIGVLSDMSGAYDRRSRLTR